MWLDPLTLRVVSAFTLAIAAILLLSASLHQRHASALAAWSAAFALAAVAAVLVLSRDAAASISAVATANAILASAYGLLWSGARLFNGRSAMPLVALVGTAVWIASYVLVPEAQTSRVFRNIVMAGIGVAYTLAAAAEIWRGRHDRLKFRWPVVAILVIHAFAIPLRIPLAMMPLNNNETNELVSLIMLEVVLLSMCCAYLLPGMTSERVASKLKRDATIDPLTGARNRRYLVEQGERIIMRHVREQRPVSLLLFDLDHFKSVNDRFGHAAGDEVLVTFCRIVEEHLRPTDIFARLGGEEFVSLLPGSSPTDAWTVAERLRKVFGGTPHRFNDAVVHCTLSVGLSSTNAEIQDLFGLLTNADHALYRAKHSGRNRSVAQSSSPPRRIATSGKL